MYGKMLHCSVLMLGGDKWVMFVGSDASKLIVSLNLTSVYLTA